MRTRRKAIPGRRPGGGGAPHHNVVHGWSTAINKVFSARLKVAWRADGGRACSARMTTVARGVVVWWSVLAVPNHRLHYPVSFACTRPTFPLEWRKKRAELRHGLMDQDLLSKKKLVSTLPPLRWADSLLPRCSQGGPILSQRTTNK
jgi:hypothetical protein